LPAKDLAVQKISLRLWAKDRFRISIRAENRMANLNEPVTVDKEVLLCEAGNTLAIRFLAASRDAVILLGVGIPHNVAWRVEEALPL
jgi:hypothetical protein